MTLGILVLRLNHLRHVEGIARAAAARGHRVWLYLDQHQPRMGPKASEFPDPARVPARWHQWATLVPLIGQRRWDIIPPKDALIMPANAINPRNTPLTIPIIAGVQTTMTELLWMDPRGWSVIYGWSPIWEEWWHRRQAQHRLWPAFVPVGLPVAEHLTWFDPADARRRAELPAGATVVTVLPFPFAARPTDWRTHILYRYWGYKRTVRTLRAYCDRLGAMMVVQARGKTPVPSYLRDAADRVFDSPEAGEPTLLHLMTVSHLVVHAMSMSVLEATAVGVPTLGIVPRTWPAYDRHAAMAADLAPWQSPGRGIYSYRGVAWFAPPEWVEDWYRDHPTLPVVDPTQRRAYLEKYAAVEPFNAGERIVMDLERRVALPGGANTCS